VTLLARIGRRLRDERGFTLIELLVTTVIGMTVLLATFTVFDSSLNAQLRVDDRTDSIARGRTAMEQIVQQLRSQVCLGPGLPAIAAGDDDTITFYADLADTTFVPQRRQLAFAGGAVTESDFTGSPSAGSPPFTFTAAPVQVRTIIDHLTPTMSGSGVPIPFFTYYSFDSQIPPQPDNQLVTPLSDSDRARVVQVGVSYTALPTRDASQSTGEPFAANVYVRTADPTDPTHSPLCI
jgi:prepilin-type N-terminal cleavage/methylation domain-containing protein